MSHLELLNASNPRVIRFLLDCLPPTATSQQKGATIVGKKILFYKKPRIKRAESDLISLCRPHQPKEPLTGPVRLTVIWVFPYLSSEKKAVVKAGEFIAVDKRPDLDNLVKLLADCLTRLRFVNDDCQIFCKRLYKFRGPNPGIHIKLEEREPRYSDIGEFI